MYNRCVSYAARVDPLASPSNRASKLFQQYSYDLFRAIVNPNPISWSLFSQDIITKPTLDVVCSPGVYKYHQISSLLDAMLTHLEAKPNDLPQILDILRDHPPLDVIVDKMNSAYVASDVRDLPSPIGECSVKSPVSSLCSYTEMDGKKSYVVKQTVHHDFQKVQGKLGALVFKIQKIVESSTSLEDVRLLISYSYPYLQDKIKCSSMNELFSILRREISPTNYILLVSIIDELNLPKAMELICSYKMEEEKYQRKLLDEGFMQEILEDSSGGLCSEVDTAIELKLDWSKADETTVNEFQDVLRDIFSSMDRYVHLYDVRPGCVFCSCRAPKCLQDVLVKLANEKKSRLIERGVALLTIGGVVIINKEMDLSITLENIIETSISGEVKDETALRSHTTPVPELDHEGLPLLTLTLNSIRSLDYPDSLEEVQPHNCDVTTPTYTNYTLPYEIVQVFKIYLRHQGCGLTPASCPTCSILDSNIRRLLDTAGQAHDTTEEPPVVTATNPPMPYPRILSLLSDEGLGRSLDKPDNELSSLSEEDTQFGNLLTVRRESNDFASIPSQVTNLHSNFDSGTFSDNSLQSIK